jgi:hypothetical protein
LDSAALYTQCGAWLATKSPDDCEPRYSAPASFSGMK